MNKNYDQLLKIQTNNRGIRPNQSLYYNHYEATPYSILYTLFKAYELKKSDVFVDYGSGKGRLLYYVHHHFGAQVTGIEMNENLHRKALKNKESYIKKNMQYSDFIRLECCLAEHYPIQKTDNRFYFFNPFSVQIFIKVINLILQSIEKDKREADIILYYPTTAYIHYLEDKTPFERYQEIKVPGLYEKNNNERFLIYRYQDKDYI